MANEKIGLRLRQIREEHRLSQEQLAEKMNMSQKTISSWEKDRTYPKVKELHRLCDIYDCTYDYLTGIKQYDSNDITLDDIMLKLATFDIPTLGKLYNHISALIQTKTEYEHIMKEKAEMEKKLMEYEKKLRTMESYGTRRE
jgi:transcriptional regulator with XRE-family HTH domain